MSTNPLVSIIVPSYNQGRFIRKTLDSILAQDYRPLEIIVIDGASTDETVSVLHDYDNVPEVSWISEPDSGPVEAVNKGFSIATGEVCAIQSSDDYYLPGAIETVISVFRDNENIGLVYGDVKKIDASGNELFSERIRSYSLSRLLARITYVPQPAAFFRLALIRQLGGWDERIPYVPDVDLWFRIAFHSKVKKIDAVLATSRAHSEQRDTQRECILRDYRIMIANSVDLKNASFKVRLASKSGYFLLHARYNTHYSDWELTKILWKGILLYPPSLFSPLVPKHRLVPCYFKMTFLLAKIRKVFKVIFSNIHVMQI